MLDILPEAQGSHPFEDVGLFYFNNLAHKKSLISNEQAFNAFKYLNQAATVSFSNS